MTVLLDECLGADAIFAKVFYREIQEAGIQFSQ